MSCNRKAGTAPAGGWLEEDQQRAWLAYIRGLRLSARICNSMSDFERLADAL
jgi:hypothetical protein